MTIQLLTEKDAAKYPALQGNRQVPGNRYPTLAKPTHEHGRIRDLLIYGALHNIEGAIALFTGIPSLKVFTWVSVLVAFLVYKVKTLHLKALGKAVSSTCHHYVAEYPEKFTFLIVYYVAAILAWIFVKGGFSSSKAAEGSSPSK